MSRIRLVPVAAEWRPATNYRLIEVCRKKIRIDRVAERDTQRERHACRHVTRATDDITLSDI